MALYLSSSLARSVQKSLSSASASASASRLVPASLLSTAAACRTRACIARSLARCSGASLSPPGAAAQVSCTRPLEEEDSVRSASRSRWDPAASSASGVCLPFFFFLDFLDVSSAAAPSAIASASFIASRLNAATTAAAAAAVAPTSSSSALSATSAAADEASGNNGSAAAPPVLALSSHPKCQRSKAPLAGLASSPPGVRSCSLRVASPKEMRRRRSPATRRTSTASSSCERAVTPGKAMPSSCATSGSQQRPSASSTAAFFCGTGSAALCFFLPVLGSDAGAEAGAAAALKCHAGAAAALGFGTALGFCGSGTMGPRFGMCGLARKCEQRAASEWTARLKVDGVERRRAGLQKIRYEN
eukprot:scaffold16167_cov58-Phaeocystis_antarctica.AAC.6